MDPSYSSPGKLSSPCQCYNSGWAWYVGPTPGLNQHFLVWGHILSRRRLREACQNAALSSGHVAPELGLGLGPIGPLSCSGAFLRIAFLAMAAPSPSRFQLPLTHCPMASFTLLIPNPTQTSQKSTHQAPSSLNVVGNWRFRLGMGRRSPRL